MAVDIIGIDMEKIEIYKEALCEILDMENKDFSTVYQNSAPNDNHDFFASYNCCTGNINLVCDRIEEYVIPYIVAHEVRHRWQHLNGWINENKEQEYRERPEEIDANAFAVVVTDTLHFWKPEIDKRICDEASEIRAELGLKISRVFTPELRERLQSWIV